MLKALSHGGAMRVLISAFLAVLLATPASARLWKPTPEQVTADYVTITHNKGTEGRVILGWMTSMIVPAVALKQMLEKYVVISIMHTRQTPGGPVTWDEVQGVQLSDGEGQLLKQVQPDAIPPMLVGLMAASDASMRQNSLGKGKVFWSIWEAGSVSACQKGKLVVNYDGEAYSFDTPLPGCPKS
jgi:hypothetical protein